MQEKPPSRLASALAKSAARENEMNFFKNRMQKQTLGGVVGNIWEKESEIGQEGETASQAPENQAQGLCQENCLRIPDDS